MLRADCFLSRAEQGWRLGESVRNPERILVAIVDRIGRQLVVEAEHRLKEI